MSNSPHLKDDPLVYRAALATGLDTQLVAEFLRRGSGLLGANTQKKIANIINPGQRDLLLRKYEINRP